MFCGTRMRIDFRKQLPSFFIQFTCIVRLFVFPQENIFWEYAL